MWMYLSMILLCILFALFIFADNRITRLLNRLTVKIGESNELKETVTHQDNIIRSLQDEIKQTSVENGISPQYRKRLDNLEKQSVKDKELLANYETELTECKTGLTDYKELVETLKSDIIFKKAESKKHRDYRPVIRRVNKPIVDINIPLKDIPKQVLIRVIYYIECSNLSLKVVSFKEIVKTLGYDMNPINCRIIGRMLRDMHFKVRSSRDGMVLLLHNDRNRKKLNKLYKKYCPDEK